MAADPAGRPADAPAGTETPTPPAKPAPPPPGPKPSDGKPFVTAPARVFEMPSLTATGPVAVVLPGRPDDSCIGGGGRFILFRIPARKELAVLDVCRAKLRAAVPLPHEAAPFAAGMTALVVCDAAADTFQRWDLETLAKGAEVKNTLGGKPERLLMGHRTDGPLYVGGEKVGQDAWGYAIVRTDTFAEFTAQVQGTAGPLSGPAYREKPARANLTHRHVPKTVLSDDGRVLLWREPEGNALRIARVEADDQLREVAAGPNPADMFLYGYGQDPPVPPVGPGAVHRPRPADPPT